MSRRASLEVSTAVAPADPRGESANRRSVLLCVVGVAAVVACVTPISAVHLGERSGFIPAVVAVVLVLDLISAVLLVRQFRDSGEPRALTLACSYSFSLVVVTGFGAAFPGVVARIGPLGGWPSTAPWLWVVWHAGFPILLGASVAPWPRTWIRPVEVKRRTAVAWLWVSCSAVAGVAVVVAAVNGEGWLPTIIRGTDTTRMTQITAPFMLPVVGAACLAALYGSLRLDGPLRWAVVAAAAAFGDVLLTLFSYHRYSLGWYVGRTLTVVSCGVVLIAMLSEFSRLKSQLAVEADLLRALLVRTEELEAMHSTLLNHMTDGVMLQDGDGKIVATNPAAHGLLGVSLEQLRGDAAFNPEWQLLRPDGTPCPLEESPSQVTLRTGEPQRNTMLGIRLPDNRLRWLRTNTSSERSHYDGAVTYVVTSMTDETERHQAELLRTRAWDEKRERVQEVIDAGGPNMVVQPIVHLTTGRVVGGEALARFTAAPAQGPDRWFADATAVGLGVELELLAVASALGKLESMPAGAYLSVNVSATSALTPALLQLVTAAEVPADRVVIELTEHAGVPDYAELERALVRLRSAGVRIAVDDTGAGFASLTHILTLRPDIVKLDIDLVRDIHRDPARRALTAGLLVFAEEIGAAIVAEGIETVQELDALRDVGVIYGQGYHLGRPSAFPLPDSIGSHVPVRELSTN